MNILPINSSKNVGLIFFRSGFNSSTIKTFVQDLHLLRGEALIALEAINAFFMKNLEILDPSVGDAKCQSRASILLDLEVSDSFLLKVLDELNLFLFKIESLINQVEAHKVNKNGFSLFDYSAFDLNIDLRSEGKLIIYCYLLSVINKCPINKILGATIGKEKQRFFFNKIKFELSQISIEYEKKLADSYGLHDYKNALNQLESNGFSSMTPFFPSNQLILKKLKSKAQFILQKISIYSKDGQCLYVQHNLFQVQNDVYVHVNFHNVDQNSLAFVIHGCSFPGSFDEFLIKKEKYKEHQRSLNSFQITDVVNIEEAFLANSAQHPQFTNGVEIDFEGLGLQDSQLKKDYDYYRSLPGYSRQDMSVFHIDHVYASTIRNAINDHQAMVHRLCAQQSRADCNVCVG